jgi:hypothetical protein
VSRFLEEPYEDHIAAVKRIVRYVAGTHDWGLWYIRGKKKKVVLLDFSDSDYAGDVDKSEGPEKATREGVNESQSKFLDGTLAISQI